MALYTAAAAVLSFRLASERATGFLLSCSSNNINSANRLQQNCNEKVTSCAGVCCCFANQNVPHLLIQIHF